MRLCSCCCCAAAAAALLLLLLLRCCYCCCCAAATAAAAAGTRDVFLAGPPCFPIEAASLLEQFRFAGSGDATEFVAAQAVGLTYYWCK